MAHNGSDKAFMGSGENGDFLCVHDCETEYCACVRMPWEHTEVVSNVYGIRNIKDGTYTREAMPKEFRGNDPLWKEHNQAK